MALIKMDFANANGGGINPSTVLSSWSYSVSNSISVPSDCKRGILACYVYGTNATWNITGADVELLGTSGTGSVGSEQRTYYYITPTSSTITAVASAGGSGVEAGIDLIY